MALVSRTSLFSLYNIKCWRVLNLISTDTLGWKTILYVRMYLWTSETNLSLNQPHLIDHSLTELDSLFQIKWTNLDWEASTAGSVVTSEVQGAFIYPKLGLLSVWCFTCLSGFFFPPQFYVYSPLTPPKNMQHGKWLGYIKLYLDVKECVKMKCVRPGKSSCWRGMNKWSYSVGYNGHLKVS